MKAKERREMDRLVNERMDWSEATLDWEIRRYKEEVRQEELRRRRIRHEREQE